MGQYFSGGVLPNAPVVWQVSSSSATVLAAELVAVLVRRHPAVLDGRLRPRTSFGGGSRFFRVSPAASEDRRVASRNRSRRPSTYKGVTDATGTHYLQLDFNGEKPDLPLTVSANASVTDVNRQSFASNLELLVHPSTLYVGIRSTRQYVREGEPIDVEAIVTDIDGAAVAGRTVHITVDAGGVQIRQRSVGRDRRRSETLRRDVVDEAGVVFRRRPASAASTRSPPWSPTMPAARTAASSRAG